MPSSTYIKRNKSPHEMTLDELRAACEQNELAFYRDRAEGDPNNAQAQEDYRQHCLLKGLDPDTCKASRFASMSKEAIATEWTVKGQQQEAAELESYRDHQASVFLASQPRYVPTQENSDLIVSELERLGYRGSAAEINHCFEKLVGEGKIAPKQIIEPVHFFNRQEAYEMPLDELKRLAERTT